MPKGYVFTLSGVQDVPALMAEGHFSVRQDPRQRNGPPHWNWQMLETFADYQTMSPGDYVFFFQKRMLYGAGRIKEVGGGPAVFWSWDGAADPASHPANPNRVAIHFEPAPAFFAYGLDSDDVLSLREAMSDWGLRFFWKRSFVQVGEGEAQAILSALIRRNAKTHWATGSTTPDPGGPRFRFSDLVQIAPRQFMRDDGSFRSEAAVHGLLAQRLVEDPYVLGQDGSRRFLSHSVFHEIPASPPKPADYIDRMDLIRYRSFQDDESRTPYHLDVVECKKDVVGRNEKPESVLGQPLKYVDYLAATRFGGDYGPISGHFVARTYHEDFMDRLKDLENHQSIVTRPYVREPRSANPVKIWKNLVLWGYDWDVATEQLELIPAWPQDV